MRAWPESTWRTEPGVVYVQRHVWSNLPPEDAQATFCAVAATADEHLRWLGSTVGSPGLADRLARGEGLGRDAVVPVSAWLDQWAERGCPEVDGPLPERHEPEEDWRKRLTRRSA